MAVALYDDKAAGRCRCNNQINETAVAGGNIGQPCVMVVMGVASDGVRDGSGGCLMKAAIDFGKEVARQR